MEHEPSRHPSFSELTRVSARIGFLSFGGPAGQIALMHRELVEARGWVGEREYLEALNLCTLLPGPEAQQLATWIGWKLHGWKGVLSARPAIRISAWATITSTAALIPRNSAANQSSRAAKP